MKIINTEDELNEEMRNDAPMPPGVIDTNCRATERPFKI